MAAQTDPPSPPPQHRRRSSFVDMFTARPNPSNTSAISSSPPSAAVSASPGVPQKQKAVSITSLGLGANGAAQGSPFDAFARQRRASIATSSASGSPVFRNSFGDEPAVIEEDDPSQASINPPASPTFARRLSFGAQALRDRAGGSMTASGGGRRPSSTLFTLSENSENNPSQGPTRSGTAKTAGEGFNWSEAIRDRSKRSPSFSSGNPFAANGARPRAVSNSAPEPPKEISRPAEPAPPTRLKKPDHLGERMLRGDFMMD